MKPHLKSPEPFTKAPRLFLLALAGFFLLGASAAQADTITLKNGRQMKGLVVEEHADRIILSTEKGEVPLFRKGIEAVDYDTAEQNFLQVGRALEEQGKLGPALAYYEKALELNPAFEEAKTAAIGVRNRYWAMQTEGPRAEMEKQQLLYDTWGQGISVEAYVKERSAGRTKALREGLGVVLEKKNDWVELRYVDSEKPAALAGLKKRDRLVSIDSQSLRYLSQDMVTEGLLHPRFSNFILELERDIFFPKPDKIKNTKRLGFGLKLKRQGLVVASVKKQSEAAKAGIQEEDLITRINGTPTRYMGIREVNRLVQETADDRLVFTVRRTALLSRR